MGEPGPDASQTPNGKQRDNHGTPSISPNPKDTPTPCCHGCGPDGRNLIICIDGTSNQFGAKNTNVIELYSLIIKDEEHNQHTWYNSGIGTYARPSWRSLKYILSVLDHKIDLAIAWNFERTILAAYRWLSENYMKGDRIFLYGFSRGAFQVRVLSAMIEKVGLIHKGNEEQIPFAYELYADPESAYPTPEAMEKRPSLFKRLEKRLARSKDTTPLTGKSMAERFKDTFSHNDVKVHFVGVWDTVSSIGIMRGKRMLPGTVDGMKHVCFFRHALALDERRVKFLPEYAYGGRATDTEVPHSTYPKDTDENQPANERTKKIIPSTISRRPLPLAKNERHTERVINDITTQTEPEVTPHTLEVWFAGTHSDIGGGNAYNAAMDRSRPPLRWMIFESGTFGLRTKLFDRPLLPDEQVEVEESLTWPWMVLELLPLTRLTFSRSHSNSHTTHKPHLGSARKIHAGQKIHGSLLRTDRDYIPKAQPPSDDANLWTNLHKEGLKTWQAVDLYEATDALVNKSIQPDQEWNMDGIWSSLRKMALASGDGRQAVYESIFNALSRPSSIDLKHRLITKASEILQDSNQKPLQLKKYLFTEIRESISDFRRCKNEAVRSDINKFLNHFVNTGPIDLKGHTDAVSSIAIFPDGRRIISGSRDATLRIWQLDTGTLIGRPLRGHTDKVYDVAISPNGKLIASVSADGTVRLWDPNTGNPIGKPLEGHTSAVWSVAFSPDSKYLASGSWDHSICIWDVESGKRVGEPLRGHKDIVNSVAYSPNGKYLASGSFNGTLCIWDTVAREPVGEIRQTHASIYSVAFSPDSSLLASGSSDGTVCIWNMETVELVGKPFQAHNEWVCSVAFSPDGQRIASGSDDKQVLVWDAETKEIQYTFPHNDWVSSVAFSPDGKSVVSGCDDAIVRVWDVEPW